jgi:predicted dehydrogenase
MEDLALSRRSFLAATSAVAMTALGAGTFANVMGQDRLRVGVVGCGGRGTGAAFDCLNADPAVTVVALGDMFADRAAGARKSLTDNFKERVQITDDHVFTGFDAYKGVLASDIDLVILATPPGFRPYHFEAAINAGKHVFMEKPVATDAPGVRRVIAAAQAAKAKNLSVVAGTQRRHETAYNEVMKRIHDGAIGDIVSASCYWNQGSLWSVPRQEGWSDVEWQLKNWLYFTYLSGDHICEQHIHNIDVVNWAKKAHPVKAVALGGREVRKAEVYGHIFDHFAVEFEYEDGCLMHSYCRQIDGCANNVSERLVGTKGRANPANRIFGENEYRFSGENLNPYMLEHRHLIESIRGTRAYLNEGEQVAHSTLTAIMGRMAAYTGTSVTWDAAMASEETLMPADLAFGSRTVPAVAVPGVSKLV